MIAICQPIVGTIREVSDQWDEVWVAEDRVYALISPEICAEVLMVWKDSCPWVRQPGCHGKFEDIRSVAVESIIEVTTYDDVVVALLMMLYRFDKVLDERSSWMDRMAVVAV